MKVINDKTIENTEGGKQKQHVIKSQYTTIKFEVFCQQLGKPFNILFRKFAFLNYADVADNEILFFFSFFGFYL